MVAPSFTERRSKIAKQIGLGRKSEESAQEESGADAKADMPEIQHLAERMRRRKVA